jgi:hypothetical protein
MIREVAIRLSTNHTEHVAEVRAGRHFDGLGDVAKYAASFQYAPLQDQEAVLYIGLDLSNSILPPRIEILLG